MRKKSLTLLLISVCGTLTGGVLLLSSLAHADTVVKPNTFTSGTPASADEVNANFDTVYDQVNKVGGAITVDPVDNRVGIGTQTPNGELHVVSTQIVPGVVGFSGTGLDDIVVDSTGYTGTGTVAYAVRVQNVGPNPDQIEYSADGGGNWSSPTDMVASGLDIGNGVTIGFAALDGHTYGDQWSWTVSLVNVDGIVVSGGKVAVKEISIENGAANGYVLTSDAAGNTTWQPTAPDNDNDPANELQTVSVLGTNLTLSDGGGTVSIADNDNDPANELNDSLVLMGTNLRLKDNGGTLIADLTSLINDADADSANELNTSVAMNGTSLEVTDAGGVLSAELAETLAIDNLSDAKYDGSSLFLGAQSGGVDDGTNNANASLGTLTLHANTSGYNNTALGSHALYANIDGANNTATGSQALYYNTTGGANTANGAFALYLNTTGANNTANGYFALAQNSTGVDNTATGYNALAQNTGNNNTATGSSALYSNTTGYSNTATGVSALKFNTTGSYNTATGSSALYYNTTGSYNTATGTTALFYNTSGNYNTATGDSALMSNTIGSSNTATGESALAFNTTGNSNTATGDFALAHNLSGSENVAVGYFALSTNTEGSLNVALGSKAMDKNTGASKNTAVGVKALYNQYFSSNNVAWDSFNTAVGFEALYSNLSTSVGNGLMNTAVGALSLHENTTGHSNTALGYLALNASTTGAGNVGVGKDALSANVSGSNITAIGLAANVTSGNLSNATAIGAGAQVDASNKVRIGNTSVTVIEGQVGWSFPSDIRIKKDVEDIGFGLDFIKQLRPVQYRLIEGNERIDFGFIAQDIEAELGVDYNVLNIAEDADRSLSLRYTDFIAPMVKAMQEQQVIIEDQQTQIANLKALVCLDHPDAAICN